MKQPSYILVVNGTKVERPVFVLGAPHSGVPVVAGALARATGFHIGVSSGGVVDAVYSVARRPSMSTEKVTGTASLLRDAYAEGWQLTPLSCPRCPGVRGVRVPANVSADPCEHSREVARYGDATPELLFCADALQEAFPDALFVQVIRDGRDVAAHMSQDEVCLAWHKPSMMKSVSEFPNHFYGLADEDDLAEFNESSAAGQCAMRWRGAVRMSARIRDGFAPERLLTLRYEEIHGGEIATAKKLRSFTGARVSASHLVLEDDAWGVGTWRRLLDREACADVYEKAGVELSHLGYV